MSDKPQFAIRLMHFGVQGWRYWAFHRGTGRDLEYGLNPNGYGTEEEAKRAIAKLTPENPENLTPPELRAQVEGSSP